ncbi:MAG: mannose-1-phosphate guanylyltransferase/mannose-6-phosphate isomerase [Rhizobiales bacterium]|nr:mannose-1-phosphate guanylyltransferase/mannose-6-phosphate isomerase [Hyphomicrobiales bacterium]
MCGGAGTRLWPASNDISPKPFLPLVDGRSTFAGTLERVSDSALFAEPVIIANREHRFLIGEALADAGVTASLVLEPEPRDTAAAVAAAAAFVARRDPEATILVLAADHLIRDVAGFRATAALAGKAAAAGEIVVFGIRPDAPATGFGYISPGEALAGIEGVNRVAAFVEKPDRAAAEGYAAAGYLWNSGNFTMRAATALAELRAHAPDVLAAAEAAIDSGSSDGNVTELHRDAFHKAPKIAFDRAVMEKTKRAAVVAARFDWSDLGTWHAVWDAAKKDADDNVSVGEAVLVGSTGSFVSSDRPVVGLLGVKDLVVVADSDAVLVMPRERADSVKDLVGALGAVRDRVQGGRARHYRPWGWYQSLELGPAHQVKRLEVKPGARLSLQSHRRRSEHWTVVAGEGEVTLGMDRGTLATKTVRTNESIYIPLHAIHRVANRGSVPLTIIEVQCGDYLGEDDIERYEDDYGRS